VQSHQAWSRKRAHGIGYLLLVVQVGESFGFGSQSGA